MELHKSTMMLTHTLTSLLNDQFFSNHSQQLQCAISVPAPPIVCGSFHVKHVHETRNLLKFNRNAFDLGTVVGIKFNRMEQTNWGRISSRGGSLW